MELPSETDFGFQEPVAMRNQCSLCQYWSSGYMADGHGILFRALHVCECHS